jgi:hypothetical protein
VARGADQIFASLGLSRYRIPAMTPARIPVLDAEKPA